MACSQVHQPRMPSTGLRPGLPCAPVPRCPAHPLSSNAWAQYAAAVPADVQGYAQGAEGGGRLEAAQRWAGMSTMVGSRVQHGKAKCGHSMRMFGMVVHSDEPMSSCCP